MRPQPAPPVLGGAGSARSGVRRSSPWVLPVIAAGGVLGAGARFGLERTWQATSGGVPWATLGVNVSGCLLIGILMVHITEVGGAHPLLRPFLGVGLLGGYTTFSTYAVQAHALLRDDHAGLALAYLVGTVWTALAAVAVGVSLARTTTRARRGARR